MAPSGLLEDRSVRLRAARFLVCRCPLVGSVVIFPKKLVRMRSGAAGISVQGTQPCRHILNSKTKLGVPEKNEGDVASPGCRVIWEGQQVPFPPARESGERYKLPEWSGAVRPADRWLFYILIHPVGLFWLMRSNCCFCEC